MAIEIDINSLSPEARRVLQDVLLKATIAERDSLKARVRELENERDEYRHAANAEARLFDECRAALLAEKEAHQAAEARVRELEDALRQIVEVAEEESLDDALGADQPYVNESWSAVYEIARAALPSSPSREETPGETP